MPYNPGVSYNPGTLYQGIASLGQGLADGIVAKQKKDEEKKQKEQARIFARQFIAQNNSNLHLDDKTVDAGVDAMGGAAPFIQMANQVTEAEQQKKARELQALQINQAMAAQKQQMDLEKERSARENANEDRNRVALIAASNPSWAASQDAIQGGASFKDTLTLPEKEPVQIYASRGGNNPQHMAALNVLAANLTKREGKGNRPELMDLGHGVRVVSDGSNFVRVPDPKDEKDAATTVNIGGRVLTNFGNKIFDNKTGELVAPEKPMDAYAASGLLTQYQQTLDRANERLSKWTWTDSGKAKHEADSAKAKQLANLQAQQLGYKVPFPGQGVEPTSVSEPSGKPAAGSTGKMPSNPTKGDRIRNNGFIYEYDGQKWLGVQ